MKNNKTKQKKSKTVESFVVLSGNKKRRRISFATEARFLSLSGVCDRVVNDRERRRFVDFFWVKMSGLEDIKNETVDLVLF